MITAFFNRRRKQPTARRPQRGCIEALESRTLLAANLTELPGGSHGDLVALHGRTYFGGGSGLYVTDGTPAGTKLLHSFQYVRLSNTIADGRLYFAADDGVAGLELWRTDGSDLDTELVVDINPGPQGSNLQIEAAFRGKVYFSADDGTHGTEPYVSDGSAQGAVMLADIAAGSGGSFPSWFAVGGDSHPMVQDRKSVV